MRLAPLALYALPCAALIAGGCLATPKWVAEPAAGVAPVDPADIALDAAADCFARRDDAAAAPHLADYLRHRPDAHPTRFQLAELLYRQGDLERAEAEFDRLLRDTPEAGPAREWRAQCHARLATLAEARGDDYAEQLHRGVGLVRLVEKWDADPARRDDAAAESALAQALAALGVARELRPNDARANLYASLALTRLGQDAAAGRLLHAARAGLPDAALSEAERDRLADDATSPR